MASHSRPNFDAAATTAPATVRGENSLALDASEHDGDWTYYKDQSHLHKRLTLQLKSFVEAYGYHLPEDPSECLTYLEEHLEYPSPSDANVPPGRGRAREEAKAFDDDDSLLDRSVVLARGILSQGSTFIKDTNTSAFEKMEQLRKELPEVMNFGCDIKAKGIGYEVQRPKRSSDEPTVGDNLLGVGKCLLCLPLIERLRHGTEIERKTILKDVNATFKAGTMTLVLGAPGSGKSTLLKALAGLLKSDRSHVIKGDVRYNGLTKEDKSFSLPKVAHFVEQGERHLPIMTVEETFKFAYNCMSRGTHYPGSPKEYEALTSEQKDLLRWMDSRNFKVEMLTRYLGLLNARNTIVGNNSMRGVSGGERRRVTLGEMLCGPHACFLMDSISTGLDASTTFDIMSTLKAASRVFMKTTVVALLQPPPETYALFDNVCLLAKGTIIYVGKRDGIVPYFNKLGYKCPPRKDEADWLVELAGPNGKSFMMDPGELAELTIVKVPETAEDFHAMWLQSSESKIIEQELAKPGERDGTPWPWVCTRKHAGSWFYHFNLCTRNHLNLLMRDRAYLGTQLGSAVVMGAIVGSIFYQVDLEDVNTKFGLLFYSLLFLTMSGMSQIPTVIENRGVFYKQSMAAFYPTSCEVVADTVVQSMLTMIQSILFAPIVYFLAGLSDAENGARFFTFMVIVIATNTSVTQFFRLIAAFLPDFQIAQGFGGFSIMLMCIFCGYLIPADNIPDWWIWMHWVNPLTWAFRSAVLNEFLSPDYDACGNDDCSLTLGEVFIEAYGFQSDSVYIWGGVAFTIAEFLLSIIATVLSYEYLRWDVSDSAPILPEATGEGSPNLLSGRLGSSWRRGVEGHLEGVVEFNAPVAELKRQPSQLQVEIAFEPVTLAFKDITYNVPHPSGDGELTLLSGISGFCKPSEMTALMGSSGAGKTTLMDVLAGRKTGGTITGEIHLNGHLKDQKTFNRVVGYVEQQDMQSALVTVKEALMFSASMRLDQKMVNKTRRENYVDSILLMLELDSISDRLIGSEATGGLSLEQRKRTTLGVELAANPSLIFLDEPTSGLDARSAQVVMRAIRKVAATRRAVICTIHQPSTYLFEMFDALLLLKKGGQAVFFGPTGVNSCNLVAYLESIPGTAPIQDNVNPATWMLEVIGAGTSGKVDPQIYADFYKKSKLKADSMRQLEKLIVPEPGSEPLHFSSVYAASSSLQIKACMDRAVVQYWRNPTYNFIRMMLAVIIAFVFGSAYVDSSIESEADVASRLGLIFLATAFIGVICFQTTVPTGMSERMVFYREQAATMYNVRAYALGYAVAELPYILFITLAFCSIFYWTVGFANSATAFFFFWLYFLLFISFMIFLGMAMIMGLSGVEVAQSLGGALVSLFCLFAGFLIGPGSIPGFWLWAYYLNPLHYVIEGMALTQYNGDHTNITTTSGEMTVEEYVIGFFGGEYKYSNRWYDVMGLVIFIVFVRLCYLYSLQYVRHLNR